MTTTVMITGAGSGFGKLASIALADRGFHVIATTETEKHATELRAEAPQLTVEKLDVTTDDVLRASQWDVDVLVNNAGVGQTGPLADVPMDRVRRVLEVNVLGTLAVTQQVVGGMIERGRGRVIILSSIAGVMAAPTFGPYSMSKFALEAMGKTMRAELAPLGVDVTLLNPGPYNTGFNDRMAESMWEWFDESSLNAAETPAFRAIGEFVVNGQLDPKDVVAKIVELVEADKTAVNNFMPPEIRELVDAALKS
jgi:NAD(P)-dependent dehydrogenase (short-subunit alcohol dehydrogenase family)